MMIRPASIRIKQGMRFLLNGILGTPNHPKWSITAEIASCPVTEIHVVKDAPTALIQKLELTTRKIPKNPAEYRYQGMPVMRSFSWTTVFI